MDQPLVLPRLYAIADTATLERRGLEMAQVIEAWLEAGIRLIQFRHKGHFSRQVFESARQAAELCRRAGSQFVVDDRADVARLLDAGLHVGQDDLAPADARLVLGASAMLGFSTHNAAQLDAASREPADYLAIGPVFATGSKENPDPVVGLEALAGLRRLTPKPLVAIGGITIESAPRVLAAGIDSVAVIGGLIPEENRGLRARAEQWLRALTDVL